MERLVLEVADRHLPNQGNLGGGIMMTPPINEDYWYFRVRLGKDGQAILGFPKFDTIGIGFAQEKEDWNSNLPFLCAAPYIYRHIRHNKGSKTITKANCIIAIDMVRGAARRFKGLSDDEWLSEQTRMAKR